MKIYFEHQSFSSSIEANLRKLLDFRHLWACLSKRANGGSMCRSKFRSKIVVCMTLDALRSHFFSHIEKWKEVFSKSEIGVLIQIFTQLFNGPAIKEDPLLASSLEGVLCIGIECGVDVLRKLSDGSNREAISVTSKDHLENNCVCRVLYCNCPDNAYNKEHKGYQSVDHGLKHFCVSEEENWIESTARDRGSNGDDFSKFIPTMKFNSLEYALLECEVLRGAFQAGFYSESRINKYVHNTGRVIGASLGEEVCTIRIYISQGCVHLRPYSEKEKH